MKLTKQQILITTAAVFGLLLYYIFDARLGGFPRCPFQTFTGFLCPGCGSQRSLSALVHGDISDALQYNVLLVASIPLFAYVILYFFITKGSQRPFLLYTTWFPLVLLALVLGFWILRNIPGYPFSLLAPTH
jgi:hypothetical protein